MARIEDALYTYLAAQSAITAIVGTSPVRITPDIAPQGLALPRIVFRKAGDKPEYYSGAEAKYAVARMSIECHAATIGAAGPLASAVRTALNGYQGTMGSMRCNACFLVDEYDDPQPAVHGEERGTQGKTLEFELHYGTGT